MAPEQVEDSSTVTPSTDIYGLCATLFHVVTGQAPYQGKGAVALMEKVLKDPTPRAKDVNASVPPALDALLAWGMDKDIDKRIPDAQTLLNGIDMVIASPDDATPIEELHHPPRSVFRSKARSGPKAAKQQGGNAGLIIIIIIACWLQAALRPGISWLDQVPRKMMPHLKQAQPAE